MPANNMKLQKFMAEAGVASRRKSEELITAGRVEVDGQPAHLGMRIDPETQVVKVNGRQVRRPAKPVYYMLNKPAGCVATCADEQGRKTVLDYFPDIHERIYPVGRLDYNTEGLLLLTNDGDFAHMLLHPSHDVDKKYLVVIDGSIEDVDIRRLEAGIQIGSHQRTAPAVVRVLHRDPGRTELLVIIHEGRNRQIRRMFEAVGKHATYIKRVQIGDLRLGDLKRGHYRRLTAAEVDRLRRSAKH